MIALVMRRPFPGQPARRPVRAPRSCRSRQVEGRASSARGQNVLASAAVIELLAEHGGAADAALIAISFDTALDGAREAAPFPVVGMTEAALHVAALLGGPIGFIGPVRRVLNVYRDAVARTGLAGRSAGFCPLGMRPQDFPGGEGRPRLSDQVRQPDLPYDARQVSEEGDHFGRPAIDRD